jgi:hypothetical protein
MKPSENAAWLKLGIDVWALGWQAARVMGLRTAKMAEGSPAAAMEAWLMLSEKIQTTVEVQADLLAGANASPLTTTRRTLARYKRKVAANDRRLR